MKLISTAIFILALVGDCLPATGQVVPDKKTTKGKINQKDVRGKRYGTWVFNMPETKDEPSFTEFGNFVDNMKSGPWYKTISASGDLIAMENYKKDVLDGEAKYYHRGQVTVVGMYRGLNPDVKVDTIIVIEPVTGEEILVPVEADKGSVRHGTWRFYDELTGSITKVEEYQVDSLIYEEYFTLSKADSAYYEQRNKSLPHMKKPAVRPARKQHSYLN